MSTTSANPTTTASSPEETTGNLEVLVFHKTAAFRHESIPAGIEALTALGEEFEFEVTPTDDASPFTNDGLEPFDVIVFLNTTGNVLDATQQRAMEAFLASGKGFVGIHSATDTEYDWAWYSGLVGTYFAAHPTPQTATVNVTEPGHPIMEGLPTEFERFDEWYDFTRPLAPDVTVLATLEEDSYEGGSMGDPHPISWLHEYGGGRSFYTGFGHTSESFSESLVLTQLGNAIRWVASHH